jgi:hypothetical protein
VRPEGLGNLIKIIHLVGSRTRYLQVCIIFSLSITITILDIIRHTPFYITHDVPECGFCRRQEEEEEEEEVEEDPTQMGPIEGASNKRSALNKRQGEGYCPELR